MDGKPSRPADDRLGLTAFQQVPPAGGLSLEQLGAALSGMLDTGDDPYHAPPTAAQDEAGQETAAVATGVEAQVDAADSCEISPRTILEAMLFVGSPDNLPLSSKQVAALMRGVRPAEIDALVVELNEHYRTCNCPYEIVAEGAGYRLALKAQYDRVREKFYGKARQAKLSQAAIEVLSTVAYNAPITADEIARLRGRPSGAILAQLVRRQLIGWDSQSTSARKARYQTTPRFLELFGLESLEELPRGTDLEG